MKEAYVSYEVAKLLKKKGFDWECNHYYMEKISGDEHYLLPGSIMYGEDYNKRLQQDDLGVHVNVSSGKISAPTQQMACYWVEKIYGFFIEVWRYDNSPNDSYRYCYRIINGIGKYVTTIVSSYLSKYDAIEAALKYVLTNLI